MTETHDGEERRHSHRLSHLLTRTPKRSSVIAGEIRSWIITKGLEPGDSLPVEKEMIAAFGASRATIREALKELEVQGLVRMKTGPQGGPIVTGSSALESIQAVQNFCYFEKVTIDDIYELRSTIEVQLMYSVVGHIDEETFDRLDAQIELSAKPAHDERSRRRQREAEFEFHTIIASCVPNRLLLLMIEVIVGILVNATARESAAHELHGEWSRENSRYHADIVAALRKEDAETAARLMREHMEIAHRHLKLMYGDLSLEAIALTAPERN
ncbi:FadR/GntR family transcriptional regulator [Sulfitobacter sp. 1A12779]|uniref:FadR/GntR family transcriptional regulator n=1 Tax=Sulfitobacter TaxID=60136 RepID=UPI003746FB61